MHTSTDAPPPDIQDEAQGRQEGALPPPPWHANYLKSISLFARAVDLSLLVPSGGSYL